MALSLSEFWTIHLKDKAQKVIEIVRPFYDPDLCIEPKPALPNIEELARKAIFWKQIAGIRIFNSFEDLWAFLRKEDPVAQNSRPLLIEMDFDLISPEEIGDELLTPLEVSLRGHVISSFHLEKPKEKMAGFLYDCLFSSPECLWITICMAAWSSYSECNDFDFNPLLQLWLQGNLPIAFSSNQLLLICA